MELNRIYEGIENVSINKDLFIKKLVRAFSHAKNKEEFQNILNTSLDKKDRFYFETNKEKSGMKQDDMIKMLKSKSDFELYLFNNMIDSILESSDLSSKKQEDYFSRINRYYKERFYTKYGFGSANFEIEKFDKLRKYLKKSGKAKNEKDIESYKKYVKKENLEEIADLFFYDTNEVDSNNIKSNDLTYPVNQDFRKSHTLMVIPENKDTYKFLLAYVKKCKKYKIPYDVDMLERKEDGVNVLNLRSSTMNLGKNLAIIKMLKDEKVCDKYLRPDFLSGEIDGFIGYSSTNKDDEKYGRKHKDDISSALYDEIIKYSKLWLQKNYKEVKIQDDEDEVKYSEYLKRKVFDETISTLSKVSDKYFEEEKDSKKSISKKARTEFNKKYGFRPEDLQDKKFIKKLKKSIEESFDKNIELYCDDKENKIGIEVPNIHPSVDLRSRKIYNSVIYSKVINKSLKRIDDHDFYNYIRAGIPEAVYCMDVDPDRICFKQSALSMMRQYDKQQEDLKQAKKEEKARKKEEKKKSKRNIEESIENDSYNDIEKIQEKDDDDVEK